MHRLTTRPPRRVSVSSLSLLTPRVALCLPSCFCSFLASFVRLNICLQSVHSRAASLTPRFAITMDSFAFTARHILGRGLEPGDGNMAYQLPGWAWIVLVADVIVFLPV